MDNRPAKGQNITRRIRLIGELAFMLAFSPVIVLAVGGYHVWECLGFWADEWRRQ